MFSLLALGAMRVRLIHAAVFASLAFLIAVICGIRRSPANKPLLAILVLLDLSFAARFTVFGAGLAAEGPPEEIRRLVDSDQRRFYSIVDRSGNRKLTIQHEEGSTYFEDVVRSFRSRGGGRFKSARPFEDSDSDGESSPISKLAFQILQKLPAARARALLARAGVAWVMSPFPDPGVAGVVKMDVRGESAQYFIPIERARPYVAAYSRVIAARPDRPIAEIAGLWTDVATSSAAVVLDEGFASSVLTSTASPHPATTKHRVELISSSVGRRSFEVEYDGGGPALVVLQEILHPGWQAFVDGGRVKVWPADVGYMAAEVSAGRHRIRFEYDAVAPVWAPASLASLAVAAMLLICDLAFRLKKRSGA
jgi:hypothetical protein